MKTDVIYKFAKKILSCDDPTEAISISNYQFRYLVEKDDLAAFFSLLSESNLIYASLIYCNYTKLHRASMPNVDSILITAIRKQSLQLQGDKIDLRPKGNITQVEINTSLQDISQIADLCIADLLVNSEKKLHDEIFLNNVKRIRSRADSYELFFNKCGELLSYLENSNRCTYTVNLIDMMKYYCNDDKDRVLSLVIKSLSNRPLYFYGYYSSHIIDFIRRIYELNKPFVLLQLLELFPQINFTLLSTNLSAYLKYSEMGLTNNDYAKEILQIIACAEIMNSRENKRLSEETLLRTVFHYHSKVFNTNRVLKRTAVLRYICKCIADNPMSIDKHLIGFDSSAKVLSSSLTYLEIAAFNALVRDNPTNVSKFLKWLNKANVYRLNNEVRNSGINYSIHIPGLRNMADFCNAQVDHLSKYCSIDDLVYIYLNSIIRVYLPIEELMKIVYKKSPNKRDDYMNVKNTFSKYIINGVLSFDDKQVPRFTTDQFYTLSSYLAVSGYERLSSKDINTIRTKNNGAVQFTVEACNIVKGFSPVISLIDNEGKSILVKNKKEIIEYYSDYLDKLSKKRTYNSHDISVLGNMPQKLTKNIDYIMIGMGLIRCCYSFNNNLKTIKFLDQIASNPYRIISNEYSSVPLNVYIHEDDYNYCLRYVRQLLNGNGTLENWLYIYFNTILRSVYPLNDFLNKAAEKKNLELWTFYDAYGILLHGKIVTKEGKYALIRPLSFRISDTWRIVCPLSDEALGYKELDTVLFGLLNVDKIKRVIYAEKITQTVISDTSFCSGMNKATITLDLSSYDVRKLNQIPAGLNRFDYNKLALDELKAIKLRVSKIEFLKQFLNIIRDANPWTFSEEELPFVIAKTESTEYLITSTINDLIDNCPLDLVLLTYFNTSIKSAVSIDDFVRALLVKYKDASRIVNALSPYIIHVFENSTKRHIRSNVFLGPCHFTGLHIGKYNIVGYDEESKMVKLEKTQNK